MATFCEKNRVKIFVGESGERIFRNSGLKIPKITKSMDSSGRKIRIIIYRIHANMPILSVSTFSS